MRIPDALALTRTLVGMETINPPGQERRCVLYLADLLEQFGFKTEIDTFGDDRASLIARSSGKGLPLCLTGHLDTVPLGTEAWRSDPFAGEVSGDRVYGRGTTDMKAGVAAMVVAAINASRRGGERPPLLLLFTGGEETGCDGAKALCDKPERLGKVGAIVVGEPTSNVPLIGHKGALWLRGACHGVAAHGSTPELGVNAIYAACRAVSKVERLTFDVGADRVMGMPTINVGRIQGGVSVNAVPDSAVFDIDIRTIPGQRHAEVQKYLQERLTECESLTPLLDVESVLSDEANEWISDARQVIRGQFGIDVTRKTANYFTDASVLTPAYGNPPTIVLGPGDAAMAHKVDEYCEISRLNQSQEIYETLIGRWPKYSGNSGA